MLCSIQCLALFYNTCSLYAPVSIVLSFCSSSNIFFYSILCTIITITHVFFSMYDMIYLTNLVRCHSSADAINKLPSLLVHMCAASITVIVVRYYI